MSRNKLHLPPIMGAISEEKQSKLFSLKSERDSHALNLQRLCRIPSLTNYEKTTKLIGKIRISRRKMLSANQMMANLISGKANTKDGADEREVENPIGGGNSLQKALKQLGLERACTALAFQPQRRQKDTRRANSMESMRLRLTNSTRNCCLSQHHHEFFDFEINYIASPPLSNVRLVPLKEGRTSNMKVPALMMKMNNQSRQNSRQSLMVLLYGNLLEALNIRISFHLT